MSHILGLVVFGSSFSNASFTAPVTREIFKQSKVLSHLTQAHSAVVFEGLVLTTGARHLGHFRALLYVPSSVGSVHLEQAHWKNFPILSNSWRTKYGSCVST